MDVSSFAEIEKEFNERTQRIVWCSVATVDRRGRPRSRILHPLWEGATGWILTGRRSFKAKHLAANPFVSLSYWDPRQEQVYAECRAEWANDADRKRIWDLCKRTPPPVGYDPGLFFPGGPRSPEFGVLKLTPWRIEISALVDMARGEPPRVWRVETPERIGA